jgi:hypothetical protein
MTKLLYWNIYEISTNKSAINGVMLRGRIRKLGLEKQFNVIAENTEDKDNGVRFAVLDESSAGQVVEYIESILEDATITLISEGMPNPILSKMKVNQESRYEL